MHWLHFFTKPPSASHPCVSNPSALRKALTKHGYTLHYNTFPTIMQVTIYIFLLSYSMYKSVHNIAKKYSEELYFIVGDGSPVPFFMVLVTAQRKSPSSGQAFCLDLIRNNLLIIKRGIIHSLK
mgnify:FL=1